MRALHPLLLAFCLATNGDSENGARLFREGRFAEALAAFASAETAAGADATPVLLHNLALAALRAGDPARAEAAAERMAARGGPEFAPLRDFVRGNAAFLRAERAALVAREPEAEPFAFDAAIALAATARAAWQRAALSRGEADWPEARRNAERALLAIAEFEKLKKEAEEKRRKKEKPPPPPPPEPEKPPEAEPAPEEAEVAPALTLLSDAEVRRLLERLNAKEREKLALRRAERRARAGGTERDW